MPTNNKPPIDLLPPPNLAASVALAEYDAKTHFLLRASRGNPSRGIELLNKALRTDEA